jgi:hypothetical protein
VASKGTKAVIGEAKGRIGYVIENKKDWRQQRGGTPSAAVRSTAKKAEAEVEVEGGGDSFAECDELKWVYKVVIGQSWGTLPKHLQMTWKDIGCDSLDPEVRKQAKVEAKYMLSYPIAMNEAIDNRPAHERLKRDSDDTVVAIGVSCTTRTLKIRVLADLSMFSIMVPSLLKTAETGFEYWLYMAFDVGDHYLDHPEKITEIRNWLASNLHAKLKARGIKSKSVLVRYNNLVRKPGPVFNFMMKSAWIDGA